MFNDGISVFSSYDLQEVSNRWDLRSSGRCATSKVLYYWRFGTFKNSILYPGSVFMYLILYSQSTPIFP